MSLPDDPEARIEHIRGILHRFHGIDEIVARIPGVDLRSRIRDLEATGIPGAHLLTMSRDDHFAKMLVMIRHGYDRGDDYHAALTRLATILDEAMKLPDLPEPADPSCPAHDATPAPPPSAPAPPAAPPDTAAPSGPAGSGKVGPEGREIPGQPDREGLRLFTDRPQTKVVSLAALLPPPPPQGCADGILLAWISGSAWSPRALGMSYAADAIGPAQVGADDILTEMEIELHANPTGFLAGNGARTRLVPDAYRGFGDWLVRQAASDDAAFQEHHARSLRVAFESVVDLFSPSHPGQLARIGAELRPGPELARSIALAIDLEAEFLADVDPEAEPQSHQIPNGSIHPDRRFEPGIVLRSALSAHLLAGHPLDAALAVSLLEMRQAQVLRACGGFLADMPCEDFDPLFLDDCRRPLGGYMMDPEPTLEMS